MMSANVCICIFFLLFFSIVCCCVVVGNYELLRLYEWKQQHVFTSMYVCMYIVGILLLLLFWIHLLFIFPNSN